MSDILLGHFEGTSVVVIFAPNKDDNRQQIRTYSWKIRFSFRTERRRLSESGIFQKLPRLGLTGECCQMKNHSRLREKQAQTSVSATSAVLQSALKHFLATLFSLIVSVQNSGKFRLILWTIQVSGKHKMRACALRNTSPPPHTHTHSFTHTREQTNLYSLSLSLSLSLSHTHTHVQR